MDTLGKSMLLMQLYDVYQELLTEKQREYFESYYFDDLSISEISENYDVSRNAVHDQLKRTVLKLEDLEVKLELLKKKKQRETLFSSVNDSFDKEELMNVIRELEKVE